MRYDYSGPRLLLLRHGQTECNLAGRMQGRGNSDLTDLDRAQGRVLRRIEGIETFDAVCSPLGRARETAEIALSAVGESPRSEPMIQEISAGD
ncbi:histidine phosphatase family protein [Primorskyibacter sp. S87]|uniref:histidine phosphatase family protein n=1 Tax=Primorskyibacter sp. S87 TaxID=3415126 RepID=UPI003C7D6ED5